MEDCNDPKYKQFSDSIERCLRQFEEAKEWQDIISCLAKLHRALLAYPQFAQVPHKLAVCKRLSQCLLPGLPGGIHLKVIDLYSTIFKRVGIEGLVADLSLYASGLFPLMSYASMQVRPLLLDLYEDQLLSLEERLIPALEGLFLAVLPGLEENTEQALSKRILCLLDRLLEVTESGSFHSSLWTIVRDSHNYRLQALIYVNHRLKVGSTEQLVSASSSQIVVASLVSALNDKSVLVVRFSLDIISVLFPFHSHDPLHFKEQAKLLLTSLQVLLHRDISLQRRLFAWLEGPQDQQRGERTACSDEQQIEDNQSSNPEKLPTSYYRTHSSRYIKSVLSNILTVSPHKSTDVFPLKVVFVLLQQKEFVQYVFDDLFPDILLFAVNGCYALKKYDQSGKESMEFLFNVKQVLQCIGPDYVFRELSTFLTLALGALLEDQDHEQIATVLKLLTFTVSEAVWELNLTLFKAINLFVQNFIVFLKNHHSSLHAQVLVRCLSTLVLVYQCSERLLEHLTRTPASTPCSPIATHDLQHHAGLRPPQSTSSIISGIASQSVMSHSDLPLLEESGDVETGSESTCLARESDCVADTPTTSTETPRTSTNTPLTSTNTPLTSTNTPLTSTNTPLTSTNTPLTSTNTPLTSTNIPRTSTNTPLTSTDTHLTSTSTSLTSTNTSNLSNAVSVTDVQYSSSIEESITDHFHTTDLSVQHLQTSTNVVHTSHPSHKKDDLSSSPIHESKSGNSNPTPSPEEMVELASDLEEPVSQVDPPSNSDDPIIVTPQPSTHDDSINKIELSSQPPGQLHDTISKVGFPLQPSPLQIVYEAYFQDFADGVLELFRVVMDSDTNQMEASEMVVLELMRFMTTVLLSSPAVVRFTTLFIDAHRQDRSDHQGWFTVLTRCCLQASSVETTTATLSCVRFYCKALQSAHRHDNVHEEGGREPFANTLSGYENRTTFYKTLVEHLWDAMASHTAHRRECAQLIADIHSLVNPQSVCEDFMLERLTAMGSSLEAVSLVTLVLDYVSDGHSDGRPFKRCVLECISLLSSKSCGPSQWFIKEWIATSINSGRCLFIVEPIFCLLLELRRYCHQCQPRGHEAVSGTSGREVCSVQAIARSITRGQCTHIPPICKVADSKRVLFALSLLDTLLEEFSISLIKHLTPLQQNYEQAGSTTATSTLTTATSTLTAATSTLTSTPSSPTTATSSSLGMLELLVRVCVELLRADYCRHVLSSMEDDVQLLRIKGAVCHVLDKLLKVFISVPDGTRAATTMLTRSYFVSLLTLCEVQPTLLSFVVQWVDCCCRRGLISSTNPEFSLDSSLCLLLPILNVIHCLAQLEVGHDGASSAQFSLSELADADCFSVYTPGKPVLKQKLFWILILSMLKHSKSPTTSSKLPAAVCCLLLSLLNVIQDILTSVLPEILTYIAEILSSALLSSNVTTSSNVKSLDKVTILSLIPGYYGAGLFQEFGCEIVADSCSCIFHDAYISQWRNHLVLLKQETKNLTRLSPNLDSGEEQKGRLSWMFGSLFSRATTTAQTQGVVKTVTGTPNAVIKITPNMLESIVVIWNFFHPSCSKKSQTNVAQVSLSSCVNEFKGSVKRTLAIITRDPDIFVSIVVNIWIKWVSQPQLSHRDVFIDMLHKTRVLTIGKLLSHLKGAIIALGQMNEDGSTLKQEYLIHFLYKYISSSSLDASELSVHHDQIVKFFTDCHSSVPHYASLCLMSCALHVVVCRSTPNKKSKAKKELQSLSRKLCEALSRIASVSTAQGFVWIHRNNVTPVIQQVAGHSLDVAGAIHRDPVGQHEDDTRTEPLADLGQDELQKPTIQALSVLSNVLPHFLDMLYTSAEKDIVTSHLKVILTHVWPHLMDHSSSGGTCHHLSVQLLSKLSQLEYTFKAWKKEAFECLTSKDFFKMTTNSLTRWMVVIDNLFTQDRQLLKQLLGTSPGLSGVAQLFTASQDTVNWSGIVKCVSFVLFSGDTDQYVQEMTEIRQKLFECLQQFRTPDVVSSVLLCFRVLLIKCSYSNLKYVWPTLVYEVMSGLDRLWSDVEQNHIEPSSLQVHLSVCKLVEMMLNLSSLELPQFQFIKWSFSVDSQHSVMWKLSNHFKKVREMESDEECGSGRTTPERQLSHYFTSLVYRTSSVQPYTHNLMRLNKSNSCYSQTMSCIVHDIKKDFLQIN